VLTDCEDSISAEVLPKIADHNLVLCNIKLATRDTPLGFREVWLYKRADWAAMEAEFIKTDWRLLLDPTDPDTSAYNIGSYIMHLARSHIPIKHIEVRKKSHPWLNSRCKEAILEKRAAEGSPQYSQKQHCCTEVLYEEYSKYIGRMRAKTDEMPSSAKAWWKLSSQLMFKATALESIPPLQRTDTSWATSPKEKADLLAQTFSAKFHVPDEEANEYSHISLGAASTQGGFLPIRLRAAKKVLQRLDASTATGPDLLAARILKRYASHLALPVTLLCRSVLATGTWPTSWKVHWICPIHKKHSRASPSNYRGVHLTAQLSKVIERLLASLCTPFLEKTIAYGPHQFAYTTERGYRDALALNVCAWILSLDRKKRVALYCSDVSGAFDRVRRSRLLHKLRAVGLHPQLVEVFSAWLDERIAYVVVQGSKSDPFRLLNMIFQGTVLGPILWNCFYADARVPVRKHGFIETIFADDLNCFKAFGAGIGDAYILRQMYMCQDELHTWGRANCVQFDPAKEHFHILDSRCPYGPHFELLGVQFDARLNMYNEICKLAGEAGRRAQMIMRIRRFYSTTSLMRLYKAHVLPYAERSTPAIYHCHPTTLTILDQVQDNYLEAVGVTTTSAILDFNLAPLAARRDMAMLGLLHRVQLGTAPKPITDLFTPASQTMYNFMPNHCAPHDRQSGSAIEPGSSAMMRRSLFGLVRVYNGLPTEVVSSPSVGQCQKALQHSLKIAARNGQQSWERMYAAG